MTCEYGHPGPHAGASAPNRKRLDVEIEREIAATPVDWSKYWFTDEEFESSSDMRGSAYPHMHESEERRDYNQWHQNDSPEAQRRDAVRQADTTRLSKDNWN